MSINHKIDRVKNFWNAEVCGTHFIPYYENDADFFEQYRAFRYRNEPHILDFLPVSEMKGKAVLEIGCGNGADGVLIASGGAEYTGVDLTESAVEATRKHFEILRLPGSFQVENAEELSFDDDGFDIVYSYGVLHHTPDPEKAIEEIYRVLKPGGRAFIMLYHKRSFNYYARILGYVRLIVFMKIILRSWRWKSDRREAMSRGAGQRSHQKHSVWAIHYENFLLEGWSYLKGVNFAHHWPDGALCPIAYAYSKRDAAALLSNFKDVKMEVTHFPLRKYIWGKLIPLRVEELLASRIGWHLLIRARKQAPKPSSV